MIHYDINNIFLISCLIFSDMYLYLDNSLDDLYISMITSHSLMI